MITESLVIGEFGADWAAGIASARRHGPNLALVTQWAGESPDHFCQRVAWRLSRRLPPASIVMVCNHEADERVAEARQRIVRAVAEATSETGHREFTILCAPTSSGGIPVWAPGLAEHLPRNERALGFNVVLCTVAA